MKRGYLSEYFEGVAVKRLSAVEADTTRSNQHEYNATKDMLAFMGRPSGRTRLPARFIYLDDQSDEPIIEDAFLTLYDSRENQPLRSAEYRFYFPTTTVSEKGGEGDLLLIAKRRDEGLLVVIAANGSSAVNQIEWLFGFDDEGLLNFSVRSELEGENDKVGFAATIILESIGIEVEQREESYLETMLARFGGRFPKTLDFSAYARETLAEIDPRDDPDAALMAWMEREEILFRTLERHLIGERLAQGFSGDQIEDFIQFSLSVQNRRKSRVGLALENHMEVVLASLGIRYKRTAITENRSKPDFLFPGQNEYHDSGFDPLRLSMLAVKSTCKDRWRQVLAEADRIEEKHLLTLETAISVNQTSEMQAKHLQLVLPRGLHDTYNAEQRQWLFDVDAFTRLVLERQQ
ncbi:type II restriction endonuclease [Lysobacter auxotrophicus]|uniref:Restriction endonuclease n=1 Tax=Lysobacter auxotrophicus TaxID=2992573 RepID=A0ABM8DHL1_9GAMM|nr:type II restriction endonuclease [Lysobacter auxotrophicus]BDU18082.1 restriction endonuclease [Lysobacter auxotrophicus]